ncbi:glycosyltransferase [Patescibacteria group bacterium]|nr:glycosyltransferase [Patescibacteria group bacterium]
MNPTKVSVILPTYNEAEGIVGFINRTKSYIEKENVEYEILVIDDDSPDGTAEIIRREFKDMPQIRCLVRKNERGLASAIGYGIQNSLYDALFVLNADGNQDPAYFPIFYNLSKYYDVVSGSRFIWGGGMDGSRFRYWGSYFFNVFLRIITGIRVRDNTSGFVFFKRHHLDGLDLKKTYRGFGEYYIDVIRHFQRKKLSLIEIPVIYPERKGGKSKMKFSKTIFTYFWRAIQARFK